MSQISELAKPEILEAPFIPSTLKFIVSNLKNIVQNQLTPDNYSLWRSQITKIFCANGFEIFIYSIFPTPVCLQPQLDGSNLPNPWHTQWLLTGQNLDAAFCSTISAFVLPYIINLESTSVIWTTLETRFHPSNKFNVVQLKNTLHYISLKNLTMMRYLTEIKTIVDIIAAAGSNFDTEDIILYIINGLPSIY